MVDVALLLGAQGGMTVEAVDTLVAQWYYPYRYNPEQAEVPEYQAFEEVVEQEQEINETAAHLVLESGVEVGQTITELPRSLCCLPRLDEIAHPARDARWKEEGGKEGRQDHQDPMRIIFKARASRI